MSKNRSVIIGRRCNFPGVYVCVCMYMCICACTCAQVCMRERLRDRDGKTEVLKVQDSSCYAV